jgi:hypothetical protein
VPSANKPPALATKAAPSPLADEGAAMDDEIPF